jgi:hypothetical protein
MSIPELAHLQSGPLELDVSRDEGEVMNGVPFVDASGCLHQHRDP